MVAGRTDGRPMAPAQSDVICHTCIFAPSCVVLPCRVLNETLPRKLYQKPYAIQSYTPLRDRLCAEQWSKGGRARANITFSAVSEQSFSEVTNTPVATFYGSRGHLGRPYA